MIRRGSSSVFELAMNYVRSFSDAMVRIKAPWPLICPAGLLDRLPDPLDPRRRERKMSADLQVGTMDSRQVKLHAAPHQALRRTVAPTGVQPGRRPPCTV